MADTGIKIPNLDLATVADGDDLLVIVDVSADVTKRITKSQFISDIGISLDSLSVAIASSPSGSGSISYNNTTGVFTFTQPDVPADISDLTDTSGLLSSAATSALSGVTTSDVAEGSNLYFTPIRAIESLNEGTGIDINYANGTISIGQPVNITSNVRFNDVTVAGTLSVNGQNLTESVNSALSALDTDSVPEGDNNEYFTTARARASISDGTGVDYNATTGVVSIGQNVYTTSSPTFNSLTLTGDLVVNGQNLNDQFSAVSSAVDGLTTSDVSEGSNLYFTTARARGSFSNGTGVSINQTTGAIGIGQAVGTTANVTFNNGNFNGTLSVGSISNVEASLNAASGALGALTTDSVSEASNLYFTPARARSSVSGGTGVTYNSSTGEISIGQAVSVTSNVRFNNLVLGGSLTVNGVDIGGTLTSVAAQQGSLTTSNVTEGSRQYFTEARARGSLVGGTGVVYDDVAGTIAIGQEVSVTSNVTFNNGNFNGTLSVGSISNVEAAINSATGALDTLTTDSVSEGTNLYFTTSRARNSITAGTGVTYNSSTGAISIGQAVNTNSNVTFNNATFNGDMTVSGTINGTQFPGTLAFPIGGIILWSGSISNIPSGWALCNGSNNTPDLTDRFVIGAGDHYDVGDTGGAESVTLTSSQMPYHSHSSGSLATDIAGQHQHQIYANDRNTYSGQLDGVGAFRDDAERLLEDWADTIRPAGNHTHNISGTTGGVGGGLGHENRPPYYALAYIMKIS